MNDTWHSGDIDAAKADLLAAGWTQMDATTWKAPDGSLHRGPAGAWRTMKRAQNDARSSTWRGEPSRAFLDEQAQVASAFNRWYDGQSFTGGHYTDEQLRRIAWEAYQAALSAHGEPPSTNAVDPSAQLPGTPTPRDGNS